MNEEENKEEKSPFKLWKIIIPVVIGVGVSVYLFITSFKPHELSSIHLTTKLIIGLLIGVVTVVLRDSSFVYKLRLSTGERVGWLKTLQSTIMWEFSATITPKLSETAAVVYILKRSGLTYGRSIAAMMLNSFMDNLVFVTVFTILFIIKGKGLLTLPADCPDLAGNKILHLVRVLADKAWIGYVIMMALCIFFGVSLFVAASAMKRFFYRLAEWKFLKRFRNGLTHLGDEIELTSAEYKNRSIWFWVRLYVATFINWSARYALAGALFYAFSTSSLNFFDIYARQYVHWIFMVIPATPGSSGVAELSFIALNCGFMPVGLGAAIALIWRIYSYYLYLVAGLIVLPRWVADIVASPDLPKAE